MVHRGIATLSAALMLCFLLLSHFEPQFFLLHFYQSLIFLVIILLVFYMEDRWAYMLGMVAPAVWLLLLYAVGLAGGALRQMSQLMFAQTVSNVVSLMAAIAALLAIALIAVCAVRWKRQLAGQHAFWGTFLWTLFGVVIYYGILAAWFWRSIPQELPGVLT